MIIIILLILIIFLIILFVYGDKMFKTENFDSNNIKLAIHTIFLLKENIPFLREWIIYHLNLGIDKIYLYDNTGSVGRRGSTKDKNKYGVNFNDLIILNDDELDTEMESIINDFPNKIVYVKWQPKDEKGNIIYGQIEGTYDYLDKYGKDNEFTAFIDTDEFLFSKNNINLKDYINKTNKDKYVIYQKKFMDRFCYKNKNVIEIDDCIEIDTRQWGFKCIIRNDKMTRNAPNTHFLTVSTKNIISCHEDDIRFNHYNVNLKQLDFMKGYFKKDFFEYSKDSSILRYKEHINKECNNKCGNYNKFIHEDKLTDTINQVCINLK
jgi:hypothetical protein